MKILSKNEARELIKKLSECSGHTGIAGGQFLDLNFEKKKMQRYFTVITKKGNSSLRNLANDFSIDILDLDSNLSGRFSAFSPVGLLPAAISGLDITKIRKGALFLINEFLKKIIQNLKFISNNNSYKLIVELKKNGITNKNILDAIKKIPRELFVSKKFAKRCYENIPLPIDCNQTISQPYVVAFMIECLKLKNIDKVLEIGTGTGYQTALLAHLCKQVCTIEIFRKLYNQAKTNHNKLKLKNISYIFGNGINGWNKDILFDAIIISAATESAPIKLLENLKNGGKIIFPKKYPMGIQKLILSEKINKTEYKHETLTAVSFVPLLETNVLESSLL